MADNRYRRNAPLTYSYEERLAPGHVVTVPLRNRLATGFVLGEVEMPSFTTKEIKTTLSAHLLPDHCLPLANWLKDYYHCSLGEALRQFAPAAPITREPRLSESQLSAAGVALELNLEQPLTHDQQKAINDIDTSQTTTILLHGNTGTGKTRVYLDLARKTLESGRSVLMLTPEIALTAQLSHVFSSQLRHPVYVWHSQLTPAHRKKVWLSILEAVEPVVVIGPRSALFSPVRAPGLIILDEAHEPAYKQEQAPRYHAGRVASQAGTLTGAKVILGTATPAVVDYYLAESHGAVTRMTQPAIKTYYGEPDSTIIDIKDRSNFSKDPYISSQLIEAMQAALTDKKQIMIYLNRRGAARLILCNKCGWQLLCPNCDIPLVYHAEGHLTRCHICGFKAAPPINCHVCANPDIIYKSIGTQALLSSVTKLFPQAHLQRFDSDNVAGERLNDLYGRLREGKIDILIGTQILAKGLDLPKLGLVGVIAAESSMSLPDYTSEERSFQLLYQVTGRVGRGHGPGQIIIQTYEPSNIIVQAAAERDYQKVYEHVLKQRQDFRFPPFSYLLKLSCRRASSAGAEKAATALAQKLVAQKLPVEIIGPTPAFYSRRGRYYYWQLVVKSKQRDHLLKIANLVPPNWAIDLDPIDLL